MAKEKFTARLKTVTDDEDEVVKLAKLLNSENIDRIRRPGFISYVVYFTRELDRDVFVREVSRYDVSVSGGNR
jgi:hypothetical protein